MSWCSPPRFLPDDAATTDLARRVAPVLKAGDTLCLDGPLGAGKTHFARAAIRARLAQDEDIPSPTFTLVQTYEGRDGTEIWHCDLYRLSGPDEVLELGLEDAMEDAICLIEWPDRLGDMAPADALTLHLAMAGDGREAQFQSQNDTWKGRLADALG
ncbi:tRNA (adenosine(37)-N6)-threonylcarbamoyltransferase complex ATPase subunit type 1 TsaE [Aestuariibius sp. 2305UL40-4]|uniref:tRNA (adenosine(37)-N6)-threonylcarbamoyltransferase complex ATPase subunit type 1 TsaE n=1 Tax=Aestuariibius violaceus TaxID=3234132 RepID=UPI00345E3332